MSFITCCSGLAAPDICSRSPVYNLASLKAEHRLGGWTLNPIVLQGKAMVVAKLAGIAILWGRHRLT